MRTTTYMILLAAPLALAACDNAAETTEQPGTMMSDDMADADAMPMSDDMPMMDSPYLRSGNADVGQLRPVF